MVKIYNYTVLIEQDEEGIFIAKVPDITGCYTQGKTIEEVMNRIREAIEVCLEAEEKEMCKLILGQKLSQATSIRIPTH